MWSGNDTSQYDTIFQALPNYQGIRRYVAARWNVLAAGESKGHGHCRLSCAPEPKSRLLQGPGEEIEGKSFLHAPLQMRGGWRRSNQINSTGVALFVNGVIHFSFFSGSVSTWVGFGYARRRQAPTVNHPDRRRCRCMASPSTSVPGGTEIFSLNLSALTFSGLNP